MNVYQKDPRLTFSLAEKNKLKEDFSWSKKIRKGPFRLTVGTIYTPYRPISRELFKDSKFQPLKRLIVHRYTIRKNNSHDDPKTSLLFIHGYAESRFMVHEQSYFRFFRKVFNADIYATELPYHHQRQPTDSPFSGAYFLSGNPLRMLEAFRQSIQEIIALINYLKESYDRVILFGVSLGGHLVTLVSQMVNAIEIIAAQSSAFLFRLAAKTKIVPIANTYINRYKEMGIANLYKILYPCNLKYFGPNFTTNKKTALIAGLYDRIVPVEQSIELAQLINKPIFFYQGGHLTLIPWLYFILLKINRLFMAYSE